MLDDVTHVPHALTLDTRLSLTARGLMASLLSYPDGTDFTILGLSGAGYLDTATGEIVDALGELLSSGWVAETNHGDRPSTYTVARRS